MTGRHRFAVALLLGAGMLAGQNQSAPVQAPPPVAPPPQAAPQQAAPPSSQAAAPSSQVASPVQTPQNTPTGRLTGQQAAEMISRCLQLMESTVTVLPTLKGSSVSLIADARTVVQDLQRTPGNSSLTYHFLNDVQAYLQLTDVLPRPADLPQEGQRQLNELHDSFGRLETYFRQLLLAKELQLR